MGIYCNLTQKCVISPIISKTRNHGFDGTGLYCGKIENATGKHSMDLDYEGQEIDDSETIEIVPDREESFEENKRRLEGLFRKTDPDIVIVGAADINEEDHANRIGVDTYVNTGVLTMDMVGIRKMYTMESMTEEISKIISQPIKIILGDQDIINLLFAGHIQKVSNIYNFQRLIHKAYCLKNPSIVRSTVIAHFITGDKPWHNDYLMVYAREYYSYLRKYLTVPQRLAWWAQKPKGIKNMYDRHKEWTDLVKTQS